eukprot:s3945_g17.t1
MELYRSLVTFPWQVAGVLGNRVKPLSKSYLGAPGIDDEAAEDPEEAVESSVSGSLQHASGAELETFPVTPLVPLAPTTPVGEVQAEVHVPRRTPPPPTAAVAEQENVEGAEQAGHMELESGHGTRAADTAVEGEPDAKRLKVTVRRIGDEDLVHVDMDVDELYSDNNIDFSASFDECFEDGDAADDEPFVDDECLWQPYSELEPCLEPEILAKIDEYGDKIEISRLTAMGVLTTTDQYSGEYGKPLSAKFVRAWRKKTRKVCDSDGNVIGEEPAWMRRSGGQRIQLAGITRRHV